MSMIVDKFNSNHEQTKQELAKQVADVEAKLGPREFVQNRDAPAMHKVLSYLNGCGLEAKGNCGWKYARSSFQFCSSPGVPKMWRGSCFPERKAAIAHDACGSGAS